MSDSNEEWHTETVDRERMTFTADLAEVANLLARCCELKDRGDVDAWVRLFTPDGSYELNGVVYTGHAKLREMAQNRATPGTRFGALPVIDIVARDDAKSVQRMLFIDHTSGALRGTLFEDDLRRTHAGWRIAKRVCRFEANDCSNGEGEK